jgi:aminopeptidase
MANYIGNLPLRGAGLVVRPSLAKHAPKLVASALKYLSQILHLRRDKTALIIYDQGKQPIGKAFVAAAQQIGAAVVEHQLAQCRFDNGGLEEVMVKVKMGHDVCCNYFDGREEETPARIKLLKAQMASGARVGHSPGISEEMLGVEVDFEEVRLAADKVIKFLAGAEKVVISSDQGTKIEINIKARPWHDDITLKRGEVANIPCGELYCAPDEEGANGIIVVDGSIGDFGIVPNPLVIEVSKGRILQREGELIGVRWKDPNFCDREGFLEKVRKKLITDRMASVIGELGIGLAPFDVVGNLLQDEKAIETIHIAFGENEDFGGKNNSEDHRDFLVLRPTIVVYYCDQAASPRTLMERGALLI